MRDLEVSISMAPGDIRNAASGYAAVRQLICEDSRRWLSIKEASMMLAQRPAAWAVIWRVLWARIANSSHGAKSEAEAMRSVLVDTDCEWNDCTFNRLVCSARTHIRYWCGNILSIILVYETVE